MKDKYAQAIYRRILLLISFSALLAIGVTLILLIIVVSLLSFNVFYDFLTAILRFFYNTIGVRGTITVSFVTFFVLFSAILIRKRVRYLSQIIETIEDVSKGNFEATIPVYSKDELSKLASFVNRMADRLQFAIEEERQAVQAKNELITNVSHDLRTPLTSVIGYLRLIEEDRYKDEVELRHYVHIAYHKSKRLERMVNDLFEYTRVSYGGIRLNVSSINLIELIGQIVADYSLLSKEQNLEMQVSFDQEKLIIEADGDKLMRVFENLLTNAIKYGKEGKRVVVNVVECEESVVIQVINFGSKIPATDIPYLFERFYRIEKSRSEDTGGSGLGLAIAKNIIDLHKGTISVKSDENETVFEVQLPKNLNVPEQPVEH